MSRMSLTGTSMVTGTSSTPPLRERFRCLTKALVPVVFVYAGAAQAGSWRVVPEIAVSETYSTNLNMAGDAGAIEGLLTNVMPSLRVDGRGSRVSGYLDYRRDESYSPGHSFLNGGRNFLTSYAAVEAVDNWLYVDASANIVQRDRSVFSPNSAATSNATANQRETRVFQVSPYVAGRALGTTDYLLRYSIVDARSSDATLVPTRVEQLVGSLRTQAGPASMGWFADGHSDRVDNDVVGKRNDQRYRGGIIFPVLRHFHVLAFTGRERTDYVTGSSTSVSTPGAGFEWRPSEHAEAIGMRERRSFGHGHDVLLTYRTARTVWRYSDVKDAAVLPMGLTGFNRGSIYDLMSDLLRTSMSDPVTRNEAAAVRTNQIGPVGGVADASGVLTSRIFVDRTRQASAALSGTRSVFTLLLQQREQHLLGSNAPGVQDDFALSPDIRDRSALVSWVHRVTPVAELNVSAVFLKRQGSSATNLESTQRTGTVGLSFGLSQRARASIAMRATNFTGSGGADVVNERALVGTLSQRF